MSRGDRSRPAGERTAQERERDRLERERRRAERGGEPVAQPQPPETPVSEQSPPPVQSTHAEPLAEPPVPAAPLPVSQAPAAESHDPTADLMPHDPAVGFEPHDPTVGPAPSEPKAAPDPPVRVAALASAGASSHPRRRSLLARVAAVVALAAVIVAVVLLAHSMRSKPTKTIAAPTVVKVLIPEGETRAQIAQIALAKGLKGSYRVASRHSPLLNPVSYGAPRSTPDLEGFLFPATYDMDLGAPAGRLVEEQLVAFKENFGASEQARARALHVTPYQLLIVASMVEREAQIPSDRPKIAAVIYNRLRDGMPLGIDASIYYAVEQKTGVATYTKELTEAQLHIDSPYNTRTHVGLPPTPISNPGLASIEAAAHPAHVGYLYYVAGADGCGEQVFSDTLAEFEVDNAAYKAAVSKNGGHPPTCKRK